MQHLALLLSVRIQAFIRAFARTNPIRIASFIFVVFCFLAGGYFVFFKIFRYLMGVELIGVALIDRTVEMSFFIFFMMLLFSNVITSFSTFFNNREIDFLFSLPLRPTNIYLTKLLENAVYASWATMIIALPLIIAYGVCQRAQALFYIVALVSAVFYIIIPAALASAAIFALAFLFPQLRPKNIIFIAVFFIVALSLLYVKI